MRRSSRSISLGLWSKNRPRSAGKQPEDCTRPAFGTVLFSKRDFKDAYHAACYSTKYLIKVPEHGFPEWVLAMGKDSRIRRYSTSQGFWPKDLEDRNPEPKTEAKTKRKMNNKTYAERIKECGDTYNVFELIERLDPDSGEVEEYVNWAGRLYADDDLLLKIDDGKNPQRRRRDLPAESKEELTCLIKAVSDSPVHWITGGPSRCPIINPITTTVDSNPRAVLTIDFNRDGQALV